MIRWDEPIEAVHEDGRVEPSVVFDGYVSDIGWARCWLPREFRTSFKMDGSAVYPETAWRIRNVAQPAAEAPTPPNTPAGYSDEVTARMVEFVRSVASSGANGLTGRSMPWRWVNEARAIVALLDGATVAETVKVGPGQVAKNAKSPSFTLTEDQAGMLRDVLQFVSARQGPFATEAAACLALLPEPVDPIEAIVDELMRKDCTTRQAITEAVYRGRALAAEGRS